jgi:hypothetical protein
LTTAQDSGLYKIATTAQGHIKSVTAVAKSDITALGIPGSNTTYSAGTGLTLDGTQFKVTQANVSEMINLLGEGSSATQADDYIITQFAGGGTTTTDFYRRKASNVINGTLVKSALGTDGSTTTYFLNKAGNWSVPTNTKNTAGSTNSTNKLFLVGATSQAANPQTYSNTDVFATNGVLQSKEFSINGGANIVFNSTDKCIEFNFA